MRHSLLQVYDLLSGLPDPGGFPLRALMAGIAMAESGGNPNAWVAHDPPSNPRASPSSGLYQVHQAAWPEIYDQTERVRGSSLSDEEKIVRMTELAKPIMAEILNASLKATRVLRARGIRVTPLQSALFVDAAWQAGAGNLARWAASTSTGDPREIVNPSRTVAVEVVLRRLASQALGVAPAMGEALGVLAVFGFAVLVLSQWKV